MPKKTAQQKVKKVTRKKSQSKSNGMDHDFILIAGGGFILLVLIMVVLYS